MTKRLVDINDDDLSAAQLVLGTETMKDTVNAALHQIAADAERVRAVRRAIDNGYLLGGPDIGNADIMALAE